MKQFNWSRNWSKITPYLNDDEVCFALNVGMTLLDNSWQPGDPPYLEGAITFQRIVKNKLSWYQPFGRCHWIAPFAWALGKKLYPNYNWGFLTSDIHTIAIGIKNNEIEMVMDILLFKEMTAEKSIEMVKKSEWKTVFNIKDLFV